MSRAEKPRKPLLRSARLWVPVGVLVVLVGLGLFGASAVSKAFDAKDALEDVVPMASQLQKQVLASDFDAAEATLVEISAATAEADSIVNDPVWRVSEFVPVVGPNFSAVREMVTAAEAMVDDGIPHLLTSAQVLAPERIVLSGSGIDPQPFKDAATDVAAANDAFQRAHDIVSGIDVSGLIPQVSDAKLELEQRITEVAAPLEALDSVVSLLPGVLGADAPRTYVLLFQNPAEMRPLGGLPGRIAEVAVVNGSPSLVRQTNSSAAYIRSDATSMLEVSPEKMALYGDFYGRSMTLATNTPHWDDAAITAKGLWDRQFGTSVDGVISLDTVALGYILEATGPIALPDGSQIDSKNAVDVLLNRVYLEFDDPDMQDAIYAALVDVTFAKIASGQFDMKVMLDAVVRGWEESRVLFWSADEAVQSQLELAGAYVGPPRTDDATAGVGIYLSDNQGSKMDYYLRQSADVAHAVCAAGESERARVSLAVNNNLPADAVGDLPGSIFGMSDREGVPIGDIRAWTYVYLPTGSTVTGVTVNGEPVEHEVIPDGENPVVKVRVQLAPQETKTLVVDLQMPEAGEREWELHVGPLVTPTKVTESELDCAA
ncbi:DUF4012 domain-containing protein [Agromyces sp. H66]|uniref:DUF4012 domain-containing protein n=1 Tax=Agromyces sp. H66 TaxID=2529859 RepID=UPI0010A9BF78|nr:DUF4012 domain-containing protein [Agromyces sp. H66]